MSHFPGHVRDAFERWLEDGLPDLVGVEQDYRPRHEPAEVFLQRFGPCSDILPSSACKQVAEHVDYDADAGGLTYASAASVLLVDRADGQWAACQHLREFLGQPSEE